MGSGLGSLAKDTAWEDVDQAARELTSTEHQGKVAAIKRAERAVSAAVSDHYGTDGVDSKQQHMNLTVAQAIEIVQALHPELQEEDHSAAGSYEDEYDAISAAEKRIDSNADGKLDLFELECFVKAKGHPVDLAKTLIERFDTNKDGFLSHSEFEVILPMLMNEQGELAECARSLVNYSQVTRDSQAWHDEAVERELASAPPGHEEPMLLIPYGPCGSGKTLATSQALEKLGMSITDCVYINVDNLVRSYIERILGKSHEHLFHNISTYFAIRKGWPSHVVASCLTKARETRRHIIMETTGGKLNSCAKIEELANVGYQTTIVYPLTPFLKIYPRLLARKRSTGQGHPALDELHTMCVNATRNLPLYCKAAGTKVTVLFANNSGRHGHLVDSADELERMADEEPFHLETRALLYKEATRRRTAQ